VTGDTDLAGTLFEEEVLSSFGSVNAVAIGTLAVGERWGSSRKSYG